MNRKPYFLVLCLILPSCTTNTPKLYQNEHYQTVGQEAAQHDIDACMAQAEAAGSSVNRSAVKDGMKGLADFSALGALQGASMGAAAGAPGIGIGATIGAASYAIGGSIEMLYSELSGKSGRNLAFENSVNQCLQVRGYRPGNWR